MYTAGHPNEDVLEMYAMGNTSEAETEAIEEHILICENCQNLLEDTETYVVSMRNALREASQEPAKESFSVSAWMANLFSTPTPIWIASAVTVLLLAFFVQTRNPGSYDAPVAVALSATRGESFSVRADGPLALDLDARGLASGSNYQVQLVNGTGKQVWEQNPVSVNNGHIQVNVAKRFSAGQYFVRIMSNNAISREYSLEIRR